MAVMQQMEDVIQMLIDSLEAIKKRGTGVHLTSVQQAPLHTGESELTLIFLLPPGASFGCFSNDTQGLPEAQPELPPPQKRIGQ